MSSKEMEEPKEKKEEYITLVSAEGFEFIISKRAARHSKVIHDMMQSSDLSFGSMDKIPFNEITTVVLEMVCQYLMERENKGVNLQKFTPLSKLNPETEDGRQLAIELLLAANYLDC